MINIPKYKSELKGEEKNALYLKKERRLYTL